MVKYIYTHARQKQDLSERYQRLALAVSIVLISQLVAILPAQAAISDGDIQKYVTNMTVAANNKNAAQVSRLVADNALISVSRKGKTSTLDKSSYLNLLQNNWAKTTSYRYSIQVNNVVYMGNQAKADVITTEILTEQGVTMRLVTTARATFIESPNGLTLMRAVCELAIEQP